MYDIYQDKRIIQFEHDAAVLDVCFTEDALFSGGLDRKLRKLDLSGNSTIVGQHDDAIKSLVYLKSIFFNQDLVLTGSWDKTLRVWDAQQSTPLCTLNLPEKVFSMDACGYHVVVGMANRSIWIYDIRQLQEPLFKRTSSLKHMTRKIKCMPNGQGFLTTSIEGRVAVDYFEEGDNFAFKCHRKKVQGVEHIYPVHSVAFFPKFVF